MKVDNSHVDIARTRLDEFRTNATLLTAAGLGLRKYFPEKPLGPDENMHVFVRISHGEYRMAYRDLNNDIDGYVHVVVELPTCEYRWFIIV
jgi:hypothetical protein